MDQLSYNCLIIDDEPIAIRVIRNHLANFKNLKLSGECSNAIEAMELLSQTRVDLIFMDIQMPQITGIEFLRTLSIPPKVIFITAYRDYAIDAFDLDVIDYLLKPVSLIRFSKAVNRFYKAMNATDNLQSSSATCSNNTDHIFVKTEKKLQKIVLHDILYIESLGDYLIIHTNTGKITIKERISHFQELLPSSLFIRIHRGYIVSVSKITAILPGQIEVGQYKIPVGRNYKQDVDKQIK